MHMGFPEQVPTTLPGLMTQQLKAEADCPLATRQRPSFFPRASMLSCERQCALRGAHGTRGQHPWISLNVDECIE